VLDALGLALAVALAVWGGALPVCYLALGLAYPLFHAFLWARTRLGLRVQRAQLRLLPSARLYAGVQMVFVTAALADALGRRTTFLLAPLVMAPTLVLFSWEGLVVCGAIDEDRARQWLGSRTRAAAVALAVLRVLAAIAATAVVAAAYATDTHPAAATHAAGAFAWLSPTSWPGVGLALASLLALLFGFSPRVAALLLVVILAPLHDTAPSTATSLTLFLAAAVVLLGGGAGTCSDPEESWAIRPAGPPKTLS